MPPTQPERLLGAPASLGEGTVSGYAEFDASGAPLAVGVAFNTGALEGLPTMHSDGHHCFDHNGDGTLDQETECMAAHERILALPSEAARRDDLPFKWVLLNWNPMGHVPPGVYDTPHFDVHFYIDSIENTFAIASGPCSPEFVRCDQFEVAKKPLPSNYMSPDYQDLEAVVPAMGNHLIDLSGPEFNGEPFTRTWIYGKYDGHVTFYEEMLTRAYMLENQSACFPIKSPPAVGLSGFYPTESCTRYDPSTDTHTVSMEGFTYREATAPAPPGA